MAGQVLCGYCGDEIESEADLDNHLLECPKRPFWITRRGLEREGWDVPPEAA